jgi:hypothetical protein
MNRRGFFKFLGVGAAVITIAPPASLRKGSINWAEVMKQLPKEPTAFELWQTECAERERLRLLAEEMAQKILELIGLIAKDIAGRTKTSPLFTNHCPLS